MFLPSENCMQKSKNETRQKIDDTDTRRIHHKGIWKMIESMKGVL